MKRDKLLAMLGFAAKARKIISGNEMVYHALGRKGIYLVFVAADASPQNIKRIIYKSTTLNIAVYDGLSSAMLSKAVGKINRTVIAITDQHFASEMLKLLDGDTI